jgi:hypothetical protein
MKVDACHFASFNSTSAVARENRMDVARNFTRLMEEFYALCEVQDFAGAENLLAVASAGGIFPANAHYAAFLQFQYGIMYARWNKLTSATNHLRKAAELAHADDNEPLLVQICEELRRVRTRQMEQQP